MFNNETIKNLAHSNTTAEYIFLALSQRRRARAILNLDLFYLQLRSMVNVDEGQYWAVFKSLEDLELGTLVHGRKGNPTCFIWNYDLQDVAKVGLGEGIKEIRKLDKAKPRARKHGLKLAPRILMSKQTPAPQPKTATFEIIEKTKDHVIIKLPITSLSGG